MESGDIIAVFGREPTLSAWELCRLTQTEDFGVLTKELAVLPPPDGLTSYQLQQRSGGLVKVGEVAGTVKDLAELEHVLDKQWPDRIPAGSTARIAFGASAYDGGVAPTRNFRRDLGGMLQRVKRTMVEQGRSARIVVSKESTLSSAALTQGKILERGFELLVLVQPSGLVYGFTIATQDISAYGDRDVGRPQRDMKSGVLPPKVAQVMINLAHLQPTSVLLDPFCGSGTILQEAAMMGFEKLFGSDVSAKAVSDTQENLVWLATQRDVPAASAVDVRLGDAGKLPDLYPAGSIDAVVTEPYLGPPQRGVPAGRVLLPLVSALSRQYTQWLTNIAAVLKPSGRAVMIWPFFRVEPNGYFLQLQQAAHAAGFTFVAPPPSLTQQSWFRSTPRGTILYSRPDQIVGREIVILQKRA